MSLPIHLQSIKSSGVYRFVYDKSVMNNSLAPETLRLLVGYSDKGPFNTPVYITSRDEFIQTYGNISKRLEKKGIYFHRLALQALAAGPILCLNLKPFGSEKVGQVNLDANGAYNYGQDNTTTVAGKEYINRVANKSEDVVDLYDTNRFWTLKAEDLVETGDNAKYIVISATDTVDASCSIIIRKAVPDEYKLPIFEYYASINEEMPDYLAPIQSDLLSDYFADVYVFRGQFTAELCKADGPLGRYFNVSGDGSQGSPYKVSLEENYVDAFGEPADVLAALAADPASNYVAGYRGTTIPFFKNANGSYISLDILFNSGFDSHKMLMNMNEELLSGDAATLRNKLVIPEIDTTDHDMSDDTLTYYKRQDPVTYYYYERIEDPTGAQIEAAVEAASDPNEASTPEDSIQTALAGGADIVKYGDDPVKYYNKKTVNRYYYTEIDPSSSEKKRAVEVDVDITFTDAASATLTNYGAIIKHTSVNDNNIYPVYIPGFTYETSSITTDACLGVITGPYGKGLQEALTNRVDVEYHYLVDTFDTSLINNKTTLAALAKKKDNCFAILNFPKISDYKKESTIYYTNNTLDFKKVVAHFNLPDDADGASWVGYFTQIVLTDGTVKSTVPSAGLVSNLFMDKWTSRQPYYIVAGSQYGRLLDGTLVGPDYGFSKTDRDVLEPYGINVIVYEPRRGTYINSEQTAKQIPVSALSKIHIRELVIYLQDEIAELLESYRWELNTQVLRDKIKNKADSILEVVANNGGVYDYLNICDESNNTAETIDNEFLVLDTHIEPSRGAGKMVERLYIYRTGEMRSSLVQG